MYVPTDLIINQILAVLLPYWCLKCSIKWYKYVYGPPSRILDINAYLSKRQIFDYYSRAWQLTAFVFPGTSQIRWYIAKCLTYKSFRRFFIEISSAAVSARAERCIIYKWHSHCCCKVSENNSHWKIVLIQRVCCCSCIWSGRSENQALKTPSSW